MTGISSVATRSLTIRYLFVLVAIATTCLASQLVIQSLLSKSQSHAHVINVAGRQRMLSQRISKVVHQLAAAPVPPNVVEPSVERLVDELTQSFRELEEMHVAIREGDEISGIPPLAHSESRRRLDEVEPWMESLVATAVEVAALYRQPQTGDVPAQKVASMVHQVDLAEAQYLLGMDKVVSLITDFSSDRIRWLIWTERLITCLTLMLLVLEAMFVFRPAVSRIGASIQALRNALIEARSATKTAKAAIADRNIALSAAAIDLKRLSTEIDALLIDQIVNSPSRDGHRFKMLVAHVQSTLSKLTDLADGSTESDEQLVVSRTSPRILVKDAIQSFEAKVEKQLPVELTTDVRLPASLLVDEQLFHDSIVYLLQVAKETQPPHIAVHLGYDDRDLHLIVDIQAPSHQREGHDNHAKASKESLDLLLAKRTVERLGGTLRTTLSCDRSTIRLPLDETKRMTLFAEAEELQKV
jgi:hypothetical protein